MQRGGRPRCSVWSGNSELSGASGRSPSTIRPVSVHHYSAGTCFNLGRVGPPPPPAGGPTPEVDTPHTEMGLKTGGSVGLVWLQASPSPTLTWLLQKLSV